MDVLQNEDCIKFLQLVWCNSIQANSNPYPSNNVSDFPFIHHLILLTYY